MKKVLFGVLLLVALALSYAVGRYRSPQPSAANGTRRALYWIDPMHPAYKSDKPGIAPDCGMQLVPVYAEDVGNARPSEDLALSSAGTVSISGVVQQSLGIRTAAVVRSGGSRVLRTVARVVPEDTRVYRVNAGMEGFIRDTFNDSVGELVKKDQKLATYYGPDSLAVVSGFLAATERVPGTEGRDGNRTVPYPGTVSKQGFSSVQGYTDRLRNLGMSDVQLKQIAKSGQLPESIDIVAPADGFILARSVSPGLHFERAMEFYRIADLSKVWIVAQMFENEAQDVRPGAVARVSLPGKQKAITARVTDILPQVDPNTRTLELRLEADNPGFALRPEMFVDVELPVRAPVGLTIPVDAVVDFGLKKRVFVDQGNGAFSPREIETGWQSGDRVQVVKGLAEGERVVAEGTFLLDSESKLRAAASGAGMPESQPDREGAAEVSSGHAPTEAAPTALVHDPKCGMELDPAKALAKGNSYSYRGATYYFCSRECRDEFERDPGRFLATSAKEPRVAEDRP